MGPIRRPHEVVQCPFVLLGLEGVVRQQVEHLLHPLAGRLLDPVGGPAVEQPTIRAREHLVGDVADQVVLEGVLVVAAEAGARLRPEQIALLQHVEAGRDVAVPAERRDAACPEVLPEHGRSLEHPAMLDRQGVQARGDQRLDRRRDAGRLGPFGDRRDQLLGEQRVPARAPPDALGHVMAQPPLAAERQHQSRAARSSSGPSGSEVKARTPPPQVGRRSSSSGRPGRRSTAGPPGRGRQRPR